MLWWVPLVVFAIVGMVLVGLVSWLLVTVRAVGVVVVLSLYVGGGVGR